MADADPAALDARRAIMAWRREQRAALLGARAAMPVAAHRDASRDIGMRLRTLLETVQPAVLAGYWPIRREFNVLPVLRDCAERGIQVALPVILVKNEPLEFRQWTPGAPMQIGVYDIPFPAEGSVVRPDALLIPMVGFDAAGYRLGYGGGYYDRTVASLAPRPLLIGVSYDLGRLESIRPLSHDIRMDHVITEAGGPDL
ncbi:MAG: 5-formyltetrahydrofolate cyclo-ligase [Steroidobacteraceae bacterium]